MASEGLPIERLRAYLRELTPEARALLVTALERGALCGEELPGTDLILRELRPAMRWAARQPVRIGNPGRLFFRPVDPFIVDAASDVKLPGRIGRGSLGALWDWICRDLMPDHAKAYADQIAAALVAPDESAAARLVRAFQDQAAQTLGNLLARLEGDEKGWRRVAVQIGTPHAWQEIRDLVGILRNRDALAAIEARLPAQIRNLADEQLANVTTLLHTSASSNPDILVFALVLVLNRLGAPWQMIRLAIKSAESDVVARIAEAPLALAVTLVLADIRATIAELSGALKAGRIADAIVLLKEIHDTMRALRTEMDLSGDSPWARELAARRADASDLVKAEIDALPGRVRRLLRPPAAKEIDADSELDVREVAETEARIGLVAACRNYAGELALNQIAPRVYAELQNYFDTGNSSLIDALRTAGPDTRKFRRSQADAAVRFSGKLFGNEYAALLAKAAAAATQDRGAIRV